MVEALTCLHASILTNGSLLFVWLIFTIRSLHLTVQLYGSFLMQVNGGLCSLTRVAYKTITIQFTLDNLSQI